MRSPDGSSTSMTSHVPQSPTPQLSRISTPARLATSDKDSPGAASISMSSGMKRTLTDCSDLSSDEEEASIVALMNGSLEVSIATGHSRLKQSLDGVNNWPRPSGRETNEAAVMNKQGPILATRICSKVRLGECDSERDCMNRFS